MKTKLYTIDVKVDGEWREWNGIEYASTFEPDMEDMRYQLTNLRQQGHQARRRLVREANIQVLTAKK